MVRRRFDIQSFAAAAQRRCSMDEHLLGLSRETLTCSELFVCSACILVMNALRPSRRLVLGLFSLGMCPHNSKPGVFVVGPHPGGWACGPAGDWMCKVRLMFTSRNKEKWSL